MSGVEGLKPCPFCGGEASDTGHTKYTRPLDDAKWLDGSPIREAFFVNCIPCGASSCNSLFGGYQTKAEAIAAWNRRAALSAIEGGGGGLGTSVSYLVSDAIWKIDKAEYTAARVSLCKAVEALTPPATPIAGGFGSNRQGDFPTEPVISPRMLFWAFRYALGRQSYAVSDVADEIVRCASVLTENERQVMLLEIARERAASRLGMPCDEASWEQVERALAAPASDTPARYEGEAEVNKNPVPQPNREG